MIARLLALVAAKIYTFLSCSPIQDLIMDVMKEIVAEMISERIGSFFGLNSNRRTSEAEEKPWLASFMDMVLEAVRKHTVRKKRGCI